MPSKSQRIDARTCSAKHIQFDLGIRFPDSVFPIDFEVREDGIAAAGPLDFQTIDFGSIAQPKKDPGLVRALESVACEALVYPKVGLDHDVQDGTNRIPFRFNSDQLDRDPRATRDRVISQDR